MVSLGRLDPAAPVCSAGDLPSSIATGRRRADARMGQAGQLVMGDPVTVTPSLFVSWLSTDITPSLRDPGFTRTASTFHIRATEGWGVINFQKSAWGSKDETRFTINLGVALDKIVGRGALYTAIKKWA